MKEYFFELPEAVDTFEELRATNPSDKRTLPMALLNRAKADIPLIEQLEKAEAETPGLYVMGNYRTGVAFPDCVTFGYDHAKVVKEFLEKA